MYEIINTYYRYNAWAMRQVLQATDSLTQEEFTSTYCSGNGTIQETYVHLLTATRGWFYWFNGEKTMQESYRTQILPSEVSTPVAARERWEEIERHVTQCLEALSDDKLAAVWEFDLPNGHFAQPLWKLMMHVCNHATHTRAQIMSAIRGLGKSPGNCDMIHYMFTAEGEPKSI